MADREPTDETPENPRQVHSSMASGVTGPFVRAIGLFLLVVVVAWAIFSLVAPIPMDVGSIASTLFIVLILILFFVIVAARI